VFRNRFIVTNLRERPNILKFKQIMSAYQKQIYKNYVNLYEICINLLFSRLSYTHVSVVYTVYMFISVLYLLYVYLCLLCTVVYGY
jgi:hypothetical protein